LAALRAFVQPASVIDVGCGRGHWLKAFREHGTPRVVGVDGAWNAQSAMIDPAIEFRAVDLDRPADALEGQRFDLALSLEVAEHLKPASAVGFVDALTQLSDTVVFGAAYPHQGGTNHFNEQPATWWAKLFADRGYVVFDVFRPRFWGDPDVEFWYQQNTFLYVKHDHPLVADLNAQGVHPLRNLSFMDCVHPQLYKAKVQITPAMILLLVQALVRDQPESAAKIRALLG
jgi:SAM-dependent methyltransferase